MATLATVATNIATAVAALSGTPVRCGSDRRTNLEGLAAGAYKYQLRVDHLTEIIRSNTSYQAATVTVVMHHELASPSAERTYTEGVMLTHQASLMDAAWWRAITGVYDVAEGPTLQSEAERAGNTISYSMAVTLSFTGT
jgi:hypothetical protein